MDEKKFDALVSDFYRAATGAITWNRALDGVQAAFGARTAVLQAADARTGQILGLDAGGPAMHDGVLDYVRTYHQIDPRRQAAFPRLPEIAGQWWHCHEHFDDETVLHQPFYVEYQSAFNTRYLSAVIFQTPADTLTALGLELPAGRGVLTADEREIARRLGEHMRDALYAWHRLRNLMDQALAGHGLLAQFPYPMWLLGQDRHISFANDSAHQEGERQHRVSHNAGRLSLESATKDLALTAQLHALLQKGHGATDVMDMRQHPSDQPAWLHLSVQVPAMALGAFGMQPQVLATLFDPAQISMLDPFALSNLFGLTPAEGKVAARLAEGLTGEEIAAIHGTTVPTVRTQLRQVITKLGAERAADAVRMLRQGEALWASTGSASHRLQ